MKLKKVLSIVLCVCMVLSTMGTVAFADAAPIIVDTTEAFQAALDAATAGTTIQLQPNTDYGIVYVGRPTASNDTTMYCGTHDYTTTKAAEFAAHLAETGYHTTPKYTTNLKNVTIIGAEGATVAGVLATSGHSYGDVYDYVLGKDYDIGSAYYSTLHINNLKFSGVNFIGKIDINTSDADSTYDGVTFEKCSFTTGGTDDSNGAAIRYYNEANNGKVKNITVDECTFNNCYQGIYVHHVNGVTVTDSAFDTTGHNAIALQGHDGPVDLKEVVISGNKFENIGDRVIRLNEVGADSKIKIENNTANNFDGSDDEYMKATSFAAGATVNGADATNSDAVDNAVASVNITTENAVFVAKVNDKSYASLNAALTKAGQAGAGDTTVEIIADVNLDGIDWTPVYVNGYNGAGKVTVNGNGRKITNLSAPLFKGGFAGKSGIIINELTIADSEIVSTNTQGAGAFIECVDSMETITLNNCHLLNSSVKCSDAKSSRTGGLIGWTSGYSNQNDGPVKTYVTVTGCSVIGCEITGTSVGAINGHAGASDWTYTTIENCTIKDNDLISVDDGDWRVGVVIGTANIGEVTIDNIEESGNTLTQGNVTAKEGQTNLIGRYVPNSTGKLVIDGVAYTSEFEPYAATIKDDSGIKGYATVAEALAAIKAGSEMTIYEGTYTDSLKINKANVTVKASGEVKFTGEPVFTGTNYYIEGIDFEYNTGKYNLNGSGTIKDCNFKAVNNAFRWGYTKGDITFDNCSIVGGVYAIHFDGGNGSVTFKDCELSGFCAFGGGLTEAKFIGTKFYKDEASYYHHVNLWGDSTLENCVFTPEFTIDTCSEDIVVTVDDCTVTDGSSVADRFGDVSEQEGELYIDGECVSRFIMIGNVYYASLKQAVLAAQPGNTIKLTGDVAEKVVIPAPAIAALALNDNAIVIDLAGHTLNGYILIQDANKNIEIKDGNIVNEDTKESAIESNGKLTVTNVNIKSARHAINIEGVEGVPGTELVINSGNYSLIAAASTQNVIGVEYAKATIYGGTFIGPAGTASDSGAAVSAKNGADVTINGGNFSGGKNNTLSENATATLVVNGGSFDQDVSAFVADGKEVVKLGDDEGYAYPYIVTDKATSTIKVELVKVSDSLYNIVLKSDGTYRIHEFVAAQFTFKNESTTVGGSEMKYTVSGYKDENNLIDTTAQKTVVDGEERYIIRINNAEKIENRLKGHSLTIGQIEFIGQGTINFSIAKGEVDTTWQDTNLGRYYENTDAIDDATDNLLLADAKIVGGSVADITRDVVINVTYNHELVAAWDNDEITVTLKDAYGEVIVSDDISDGYAAFNDIRIGRITVTLEAPGFRKFVYETTLDEDDDDTVVLSFWNDVKKENHKLSIEKDATAVAHNFVVGDIVMDYIVDKYDLAAVTSYYGMYDIENNAKYIKYDLNRDGDIDIRDVQYVLHTMGN